MNASFIWYLATVNEFPLRLSVTYNDGPPYQLYATVIPYDGVGTLQELNESIIKTIFQALQDLNIHYYKLDLLLQDVIINYASIAN